MIISIYTDGGCSGNTKDCDCRGAWAYVIIDANEKTLRLGSGFDLSTTNNRMELAGAISGAEELGFHANTICDHAANDIDCVIVTDSKYVCDGFNDYLPTWAKNRWRKSSGGKVLNVELWKKLKEASAHFKSFKIKWVKGHSTNKFNQEADALVRSLLY